VLERMLGEVRVLLREVAAREARQDVLELVRVDRPVREHL